MSQGIHVVQTSCLGSCAGGYWHATDYQCQALVNEDTNVNLPSTLSIA